MAQGLADLGEQEVSGLVTIWANIESNAFVVEYSLLNRRQCLGENGGQLFDKVRPVGG